MSAYNDDQGPAVPGPPEPGTTWAAVAVVALIVICCLGSLWGIAWGVRG